MDMAMLSARLILDKDYVISQVDKRLYGSFVEHLGRCVYTGIYEPGHPMADEQGFRRDTLALVRRLNVPVVRYPGGNYVSGFRWEDSIGPVHMRPSRLDVTWTSTEPNTFGLHEFVDWAKKAHTDILYTVNLGTRGVLDAQNVVEYCNHPSGTYLSDLRIANGAHNPFRIKLWCLGNEMDGPWQTGAKPAVEYGRLANEASKVMKKVDPTIETLVNGSSRPDISTYGQWEYDVLTECYDRVDYIGIHRYYNKPCDDTSDFWASTMDLDDFIHTVASVCDAVKGKKRARKTVHLSLDEWNVWCHSGKRGRELQKEHPWETAVPLLEDVYNFEDALLVGLMLICMIRHADRLKIGCMAQLVNVIAPIMTRKMGGAWAQTIFYPLWDASRYGRGKSLLPLITSDKYDTKRFNDVPTVDAAAVWDETGYVTIFAANRHLTEPVKLTLDMRAFGRLQGEFHQVFHHDSLAAVNTEENPEEVGPRRQPVTMEDGCILLPAASWNVIRFATNEE